MDNIIIIDGLIYKLNGFDFKKFTDLTNEPDKESMRGNQLERSLSDNLYAFLLKVTENYKAIGIVSGNFTL